MIVAEPKVPPVICGGVAGVVAPAGICTVEGEMLTTDELLLASVMVTPPTGAGVSRGTIGLLNRMA